MAIYLWRSGRLGLYANIYCDCEFYRIEIHVDMQKGAEKLIGE